MVDESKPMHVFVDDVIEALKSVFDPEIPVNVYDLGLIYDVKVDDNRDVSVEMTLTTPNCPEAEAIPQKVREAVGHYVPGAGKVFVKLVWEPKWTKEMMSEDAQLALGMF